MKTKHLASASGCLLAAMWAGNACATDTFYLVGNGPVSLGMGGVGAAWDIGSAGMMVNPATLLLLPQGQTVTAGLDVITADLEVRNTQTGEVAKSHTRGRNNGPYYAPELAYVWHAERYAFGIGAFATAGVGTQYGTDSFLSRTVTNGVDTGLRNYSRLISLRIPLAFAYQVTNRLSIGGSVDAVWTGVNLGWLLDTTQIGALGAQGRLSGTLVPTLLSVPGLSGGHLDLDNGKVTGGEAESWGWSGKLGLTWEATPATRLGLAYNLKTSVGDLTGHARLTAISAVAGNIPLEGAIRLRDFEMPAQVTLGVAHRFNDRWAASADYKRVYWSKVLKDIDVGFSQDGSGATLDLKVPFNYRDTNVFALGAEYRYNDRWTWRMGAHYAQQATPDAGMLTIIPSTSTRNLTGGFSYAFGQGSVIDAGLAYAFRESVTNDSLPLASTPVQARHGQTVAAVSYTARF